MARNKKKFFSSETPHGEGPFPKVIYKVTIGPKPMGNWRPPFNLVLQCEVKPGQLEWRPYIPAVCLLRPEKIPHSRRERFSLSGGLKVYEAQKSFWAVILGPGAPGERFLECPVLILPLPGDLFTRPQKGEGQQCEGLCLWDKGFYLSPHKGDCSSLNIVREGYLPWREGHPPNYDDYMKVFKAVFELFCLLLEDGLTSGDLPPLSLEFQGPLNQRMQALEKPDETISFV